MRYLIPRLDFAALLSCRLAPLIDDVTTMAGLTPVYSLPIPAQWLC